ncbi:MAG: hypothetical protein IJT54_00920 [Candidatus Methanomethylophilaceae archaeon]|nr:hypothetical protein [Candidatus Methanomethylophilaceae archaeon]
MGINIGVCELEAENAKCRPYKTDIVKVHLNDLKGFEDVAEVDEYVTLEDAKALFPDYGAFVKRNRINEEADAIYIEKVKNSDDMTVLKPKIQRRFTNWVKMDKLDDDRKKKALEISNPDDRVTGWDMVDFDSMNEMCASCPLSWDKGRGCIGAFGPDNSLLPQVAEKRGCKIIASAVESSKAQRRFSAEDAKELLKEVEILRAALPEEGKLYVRRYSGPLDRLEAVANVSIKENCGFIFF